MGRSEGAALLALAFLFFLKRSWVRRKTEEQGRERVAAVYTQCGSALQGEIQEGIPHGGCGKETMGLMWLMKCPFQGSIHSVYISFLVLEVSVESLSHLSTMPWGQRTFRVTKHLAKEGSLSWLMVADFSSS